MKKQQARGIGIIPIPVAVIGEKARALIMQELVTDKKELTVIYTKPDKIIAHAVDYPQISITQDDARKFGARVYMTKTIKEFDIDIEGKKKKFYLRYINICAPEGDAFPSAIGGLLSWALTTTQFQAPDEIINHAVISENRDLIASLDYNPTEFGYDYLEE